MVREFVKTKNMVREFMNQAPWSGLLCFEGPNFNGNTLNLVRTQKDIGTKHF